MSQPTRPPPDGDALAALVALAPPERASRIADLAVRGVGTGALMDALVALCARAARSGGDVASVLEAADEVATASGAARDRAAALRLRAWHATALAARHGEALDLCDAAAAALAAGAVSDAPLAARIEATRVWPLASLGRIDEALAASGRAEEALREAGAEHAATRHGLRMNRATVLNFAGRYDAALEALDAVDAAAPDAAAHREAALLRGLVLGNRGRLAEAAAVLAPLADAAEAAGERVQAAHARHNLGLVELRRGRPYAGLRALYGARDVLSAAGDAAGAARVALAVGEGLLAVRRFDEARALCDALDAVLPADARRERARLDYAAGIARAGRGDAAAATARLSAARAGFDALALPLWTAATDRALAEIALDRGDAAAAAAAAARAEAALAGAGEAYDAALCRLTVARAAAAAGDLDAARAQLATLERAAAGAQWPRLAFRVDALSGELAATTGDAPTALAAFERAVACLEATEAHLLVDDRPSFLDDKGAVYRHLTALHLDAGRPREALRAAERGKARALVALRDRAGRAHGAAIAEEARAEHRAYVARIRRGGGETDPSERAAIEGRLALDWHAERIARGAESGGSDEGVDPPARANGEGPMAPASAGEAVLAFAALADGGLAAFVGREGAWTGRRLPVTLRQAARHVGAVRRQLAAVPGLTAAQLQASDAATRLGLGRLWDALVAPLGLPEATTRLTVAPCGPLHHVPWAALWDGRRHLVERASVRLVPTLGLPERATAGRGAAVLAHAAGGALPAATREAAAVGATLGAAPREGGAATRAALFEALATCAVVHAALHAIQRPDSPALAALALDDGDVTALELYDAPVAAELVVLAACDTGAVVPTGADEPLGLSHALLAAGAGALVASQWAVDDASSVALMSDFYAALAAGAPREEALASAQRAALARARGGFGAPEPGAPESGAGHPFYWAGPQLVGRGGPVGWGGR